MTENSAEIELLNPPLRSRAEPQAEAGHEIEEDKKKKGSEKVFARRWGDYWTPRSRQARPYPAAPFEEALTLAEAIQTYASGQRVRRLTLLGKRIDHQTAVRRKCSSRRQVNMALRQAPTPLSIWSSQNLARRHPP